MPAEPKVIKAIRRRVKHEKDEEPIDFEEIENEAKTLIDKVLRDISKTSTNKQIALGASTGWITGYLAIKIGKTAALALGGGIILMQIASEKGYININWDKVNKNIDEVADTVEEKITGEGPSFMDKVERYVDRKIDKAEKTLRNKKTKAKKWYHKLTGTSDQNLNTIQVFLFSFVAGLAIGIASSSRY